MNQWIGLALAMASIDWGTAASGGDLPATSRSNLVLGVASLQLVADSGAV